MTDLQYKTRLLELKTEVVLSGVEYGNGMIAFLMITAAVVHRRIQFCLSA